MTEPDDRKRSNPGLESLRRVGVEVAGRVPLLDGVHPLIKLVLLLVPSILSALVGVRAADKAEDKGQRVEQKAEAGYTFTRSDVERLKSDQIRLEAEITALRKIVRAQAVGKKVAPPPAPTAEPARAAPPLPTNLDRAVEQITTAPPPAPAPAPAGEPPR